MTAFKKSCGGSLSDSSEGKQTVTADEGENLFVAALKCWWRRGRRRQCSDTKLKAAADAARRDLSSALLSQAFMRSLPRWAEERSSPAPFSFINVEERSGPQGS